MSTRSPLDQACFTALPLAYPDPAAGAGWSCIPPLNRLSTLALFSCTFVADANVATRRFALEFYHAPYYWMLGGCSYSVSASETWYLLAHSNVVLNTAATDYFLFLPLPDLPIITDSMSVSLNVINKQAGDQLSEIRAIWKVWPHHHTH